jgi:hypothetical protein
MDHAQLQPSAWPVWRRIAFRFFFILFFLQISPIYWPAIDLPPFSTINDAYAAAIDWMVNQANAAFFHVREQLVPLNGSGDTSFSWAQELFFLSVAFTGCLLWTMFDRKRKHYETADYWLRTFLRYFLILVSFSYGSSKLFALQMPYPSQSMMATRLGDLLPMRLSWTFFGYSTSYQVFGGVLELLVGCLLLYRRTMTAGLLLGFAAYFNVMMLNLSYNIPVKLFSIHYVCYCTYLLAYQYPRLAAFFIHNRPVAPYLPYQPAYVQRWKRITKITAKSVFVLLICVAPLVNAWVQYDEMAAAPRPRPFDGLYDVTLFSVNGQQMPMTQDDGRRWADIVFDAGGRGSIATGDTMFRQRYGRGHFNFAADTTKRLIMLQKYDDNYDLHDICELHYELTDAMHARLHTVLKGDSLYMEIAKSNHRFPLAENKFQWLSEQPD